MSEPIWIGESDVVAMLGMSDAIEALDRGFALEAESKAQNMLKTHATWGGGSTPANGVSPCSGLSVNPRNENSGVLVRPMTTAPAFLRLRTTGASEGAMIFICAGTPLGLGLPS